MRLFLIVLIGSICGIANAQNVSILIQSRIKQDQQELQGINQQINFATKAQQSILNEISSYNAELPEAQTIDNQIQQNSIVVQPSQQLNAS